MHNIGRNKLLQFIISRYYCRRKCLRLRYRLVPVCEKIINHDDFLWDCVCVRVRGSVVFTVKDNGFRDPSVSVSKVGF